jgi:DNA-binding response OmpR family regulator
MIHKTPFRILLVEDEAKTAQMVRFYLEREGFTILGAIDGPSGEDTFLKKDPHMTILDIMLPGFDGLELCRRIRQKSNIPILMLTARSEDTDKAIGLGIGADDYLVKPFSPMELVARVKALLRRGYQYNEVAKLSVFGGPRLQLDIDRHQVKLDGKLLKLTTTEFDLLQVLITHPGWVFTRNHLLEKIWGYSDPDGEETVTAHISNLRRKLNDRDAQLIRTTHGKGYAYQEDE